MDLEEKIESILERVEKPARYIGGEIGSIVKQDYSSRVVLSYPDTYEVGTANQALQILYSLINRTTGAWAERAFCPWTDAAALMRAEAVPLFSLESWQPVAGADLWGITLQHELTYANIPEMLDLAGVPLRREERRQGDPLVFGGGPSASNPHPVAAFFDFIVIGDGEAVVPEVIRVYEENRGRPRAEIVAAIAALNSVFVPGRGGSVERAVVPELVLSDAALSPVVPSLGAVHDRATLEIMRGCSRGCRFCLAGVWYRPVRERSRQDVLAAIAELTAATGYQEASLSSLSTTDYSAIGDVLGSLAQSHPGLSVSLPSLRVDSEVLRLLRLTPQRKGSITLAPEAGSQRLRDVINKQVTDADIESAVAEAFRSGCTTVKLYFMIGLPTETDADLEGIVETAVTARALGRRLAASPGRVQVNVSVASFVPKAHTPFQWDGMDSRQELERKQGFLRKGMPRKQIRLSMHDIGPSLVEGAIARGGDSAAAAIEAAWRAGARFDAWSELFDAEAWEKGFSAAGTTVEREAGRRFDFGAALPWDDIDPRVSREFLLEERRRADRGEPTPDCRREACHLCGVCEGEIQLRLAPEAGAGNQGAESR